MHAKHGTIDIMATTVIALGSNLNNPAEQIIHALHIIRTLPKIQNVRSSSLYRTAPVGYTDQPDFINAVAVAETDYTPKELLAALQNIEQQFGRTRSFRNAPRTLDLDIIDFSETILNSADLQLPHPRAYQRSFVIYPLLEIAPNYLINGRTVTNIAAELSKEGIEKLHHPNL